MKPENIRPKHKGESDFFSWKLYRWLINHKRYTTVYKNKDILWIGTKYGEGPDADFSGVSLRHLCSYGKNPTLGCYALEEGKNFVNINDEFWAEYKNKGVCVIHGERAHKWDYIYPTKRKCEYCGKIESSYVITEKYERWK